MNTAPQHVEKMITVIHDGSFPRLHTLVVDDRCGIGRLIVPLK